MPYGFTKCKKCGQVIQSRLSRIHALNCNAVQPEVLAEEKKEEVIIQ